MSVRKLIDEARRECALELLRGGKASKAIAEDLGDADGGSFRRAFQRWYGVIRRDWRAASVA
jgi:AraC-like DNA-binding protein